MIKDDQLNQLFSALNPETIILTPNRRLSTTLLKCYQAYAEAQGYAYWQTPTILPINTFIKKCWDTLINTSFMPAPLVLNATQEQALWEKIILETKESAQLLQIADTAQMAQSGWKLLKQWCIDTTHPLFESADDYKAMRQWAEHFQALRDKNQWLDEASLASRIKTAIENHQITLPNKIILIGFNELSPQLNELLSACEKANCMVEKTTIANTPGAASYLSLSDADSEIVSMARWAKEKYDHEQDAKIACVIPQLDQSRDRVEQVFAEVFAEPGMYQINLGASPFNLSAGKPLSTYPLIQTVLQLLQLQSNTIPLATLSYLLRTPYLGHGNSEYTARMKFDALLRRENITLINLRNILNENMTSKISLAKACPQFANYLSAVTAEIAITAEKQGFTAWAHCFSALLTLAGWPGERSLDSKEYQLVEAWLDALQTFMMLDHVHEPVSYPVAVQQLLKLVTSTPFQIKTPEARVQILGLLEAAALPFDYLWVAGMDDLNWPPQPKPHPFIPKALQRQLHMPHATAERELTYCEHMTTQFIHSAKEILFSYTEKNEKIEQEASPLIRDLPQIHLDNLQLPPYKTASEIVFATRAIEIVQDDQAPAYEGEQLVPGGTSVIKWQAWCPFKAFAECRLNAITLETPLPGLRGKERGSLIHKALELIWESLKDQQGLLALSSDDLQQLIDDIINKAMNRYNDYYDDQPRYLTLEKQRLTRLLIEWLDIEKNRPPFKVAVSEKATKITLNKLTYSMRIDRIDEIDQQQKIIIDYKTGKQNEINAWFGQRPDDPQLPLYALFEKQNAVAITFSQIVSGDCCFKGVSQYDIELNGIKPLADIKKAEASSWDELLTHWQRDLTQLSDDFYHGVAKVDPKDPKKTCVYCEIKPLCRINEEISE